MSARLVRAARRVVEEWQANNSVSHDTLRELAAVMPRKRGTRTKSKVTDASIREALVEMTGGHCEACGGEGHDPHHLLSGPNRRQNEAVVNVVLLCRPCHDGYHHHDLRVMERVLNLPRLSVTARAAVERRMSKIANRRAGRAA